MTTNTQSELRTVKRADLDTADEGLYAVVDERGKQLFEYRKEAYDVRTGDILPAVRMTQYARIRQMCDVARLAGAEWRVRPDGLLVITQWQIVD